MKNNRPFLILGHGLKTRKKPLVPGTAALFFLIFLKSFFKIGAQKRTRTSTSIKNTST